MPSNAGFVFFITLTLLSFGKAFAQTEVSVSSISELRVAMAKSDQVVTMVPGTYTVKERQDATTVFEFSGSNNTFKFTGVKILIPVELLSTMDYNPIHAHASYLLSGSHITFIDGTFEDVYPNGMHDVTDFVQFNQLSDYAPARQMTEFKLNGDNITFKGCTITVRGSYPYGYGDMWGKGRGAVVKLKKHAGINVNGTNCSFEGVSLSVLAYGHGIFMQSRADNTVINNCTLLGRVRLGEEMCKEGEGSLPHKFDYTVKFGYLNGKAIPRNKMFALTEDGIRNYSGVGKITVKNTRVTNFRGGMSLATGGVAHVENVDLINCEQGYQLPGNSKVINCTGDAAYGPVINCPYPQNSNDVYDIRIINRPSTGDHHLADIVGSNLKIKFTYAGGMPETLRPIVLGQRQGGGTGRASSVHITNETPHPILIKSQGSNATCTSCGIITDNGTSNKIVYSPRKFSSEGSLEAKENDYARPNVILILTDDQGYGDFSVHGNPVLQTPVLDRLHGQSIRFTDFHVAPMCTPTRGQLLTGRDAMENGATAVCLGRSMLREGIPTMADTFKASGYRTVHFGKWHLGDSYPYRPQDRGFEESVTFGAFGIGSIADWHGNTYWSAKFRHTDGMKQYKGYCTDVWFDMAIDTIKQWTDGDKPFFMYLPINCPHDPHLCDDKYSDPYLKQGMKPVVARFFGQIANIDENMGRLLDMLDQRKLAENTLLIYMSDNGTAQGQGVFNAGMRGSKKDPYDGGHRVPLFIRWPGGNLGAPRDIDTLTQCQDILPTLMDWCRLESTTRGQLDGSSLVPLFSGQAESLSDRILVVEYDNPYRPGENKAVMWKKWRLVKDRELYNLASDPGQRTDLADRHPKIFRRLQDHYRQWKQEALEGYNQKRYIHLGSPEQNPIMLYSSDWQGDYADNMNNLIAGNRMGSWDVLVEKASLYEFTLSRWHPASGMALTAAMKDTRGQNRGALPVKQARLRTGDYDRTVRTETDQTEVQFKVELPEGIHNIETWFMDEKGKQLCSAYYTKAELVTGPDLGLSERYEVQMLHSDDFNKSLANWTTEIETEAAIAIVDGKLDINTMVGCTVWFNQKLSGPLAITYEVTTLDDGQDGLPRDHNLFWMALNPKAPDVRPSGAGSLGHYNGYDMYYAGIGGNRNRTTRFRRYHNGKRTLIQESTDKTHLNAANQTYRMKIVCLDNKVQVYRDGQIYWDFTDPSPYTEGWFGFRQTRTHLRIDNFKVYSLKAKAFEDY